MRPGLVDVAAVDDDRGAHEAAHAGQIEVLELVPLGHHDERIAALGQLVRVAAQRALRACMRSATGMATGS